MSGLTVTDLFAGAGGSSSGMERVPGVRVRMAANHWRLAVDTHQANLPWADHDCFPAGTLVLTSLGLRPIEAIEPGELVLTHKGRWRPVVRKFAKVDDTVVMRAALHAPGVEVTANHELWTRRTTLRVAGSDYSREYSEPAWRPIGEARVDRVRRVGHSRDMVALPRTFGELARQDPPLALGTDPLAAWWLVGRWLGDGSSSVRNHDITITCGKHEVDTLAPHIPAGWRSRPTATAHAFYDYDLKLATWLTTNFGHGAAHKGLPGWTLTMPADRRQALLDGYLSADGSSRHGVSRASTVSRDLALSVRFLAHSLGKVASLHLGDRSGPCEIQGRTVQRLPSWSVQWSDQPSRALTYADDLHRWVYVQSIAPGRSQIEVYTMEVAEDHSYVADGLVVKNCADISQVAPRRYPATDILWASPECTNHSQAKGKRRVDQQPDLFGERLPDEAAERSRATMWDIPRFVEAMITRGRPYKGFVVENVVDVRGWLYHDAWKAALRAAGYCTHEVYLNSMFAARLGDPAPQSRDRWYCVGHLAGDRCPDLNRWTRPAAWCPTCDTTVRAMQVWKRPERPWGRYRAQYLYRCPNVSCRNIEVAPAVLPAAVAIDWDLAGERIGDRARPLAAATMRRIEAGLRRYARNPILVPVGGTWNDTAYPVSSPMRTRTARENEALTVPPLLVPVEGRDGVRARSVTEPARTQTGRAETALVVPLRTNRVARPTTAGPPMTMAAGEHHAVVMRNNTAQGDQGHMSTPIGEPLRTLTTAGHQSLISWVYSYDTGAIRPVSAPLPTQTTIEGDALLGTAVAVEDCRFRMLEPHEIQTGMAFARDYRILGNRREKVRQLGNAVTPPAARDLIACLVEAITGQSTPASPGEVTSLG